MSPDTLLNLYAGVTGKAASIKELAQSGSARRYFRLSGASDLIGTIGTNQAENNAFIYLSQHLKKHGINVPEIIVVSDDRYTYLQQDLGSVSLFDLIKADKEKAWTLIMDTIKALPDLQFKGAQDMDWSMCFPQPEFDTRTVMWDLNYFKYCFLKTTGIEIDEPLLEDDFERMAADLTGDNCCFMYRDFQSRNVLIHDGKPWFIDFQGGRRGPCYYDVASFLWQARAGFTDNERSELIDAYLTAARNFIQEDDRSFRRTLDKFVLFRTLQVLGAYGFRGYFERKQHFVDSIPGAIANLRSLLQNNVVLPYPYLNRLLNQLVAHMEEEQTNTRHSGLTVHVSSFSYKKGIPQDPSGNGGGFVFDCRAIHNPGRYDQYKQLCGLDKPVIDFLEQDGEIKSFLNHCYALVDASVECYLNRNFTNLSVAFGCTGGQHRSVYGAQHMAEHIHEKYNVTVVLEHREQNIRHTFTAQ